jgi:hypothetical protein
LPLHSLPSLLRPLAYIINASSPTPASPLASVVSSPFFAPKTNPPAAPSFFSSVAVEEDDVAPNAKPFFPCSSGAGVPVGVTPNPPKSFFVGPGVVLVLSPPDTLVAAVDGTDDILTPPSPNLNPLNPPPPLVSVGLGEVETPAGALRLVSVCAERKGDGLEDEEKPWNPPSVGFGSAGLSTVLEVEGPPKTPVVDFSMGAVVVMVGVV